MLSYCKEKLHTDQSTVTNLSSHHDILDEPYPELKEPILDVRSMACRPIGTIWFRNSSIFSSYIWRCLSKAPTKSRPKEVKYWLKWGEILANLTKPFARPTWRGNFKTAMMHLKCMTSRSQVYHTSLHATGSPAYISICIPHYCIIWKYQSFMYLVFQLCIVLLKLWQNLWEALIKRNRTYMYMYTHCKLSLKFGIIII